MEFGLTLYKSHGPGPSQQQVHWVSSIFKEDTRKDKNHYYTPIRRTRNKTSSFIIEWFDGYQNWQIMLS